MTAKVSRIQARRDKIMAYLNSELAKTSDLVLQDAYTNSSKPVRYKIPADIGLDAAVMFVLEMSKRCYSMVKECKYLCIETGPGRYRSAIDIWRHIKAVYPSVDIFQVMESMYRQKDMLYGHYCITVKRAVFNKKRTKDDWSGEVTNPSTFVCREFGRIPFSTWKKLHED